MLEDYPTRTVTRKGQVYILKTPAERFWPKVNKASGVFSLDTECWAWIGSLTNTGYGALGPVAGSKHMLAHRLSWVLHNGPIPAGLEVAHRCDTPRCVNPNHLFLATHAENMRDSAAKGRSGPANHPERLPRGEDCHNAILTEPDVLEIRRKSSLGVTRRQLARDYRVSKGCIDGIVARRTWKHI